MQERIEFVPIILNVSTLVVWIGFLIPIVIPIKSWRNAKSQIWGPSNISRGGTSHYIQVSIIAELLA